MRTIMRALLQQELLALVALLRRDLQGVPLPLLRGVVRGRQPLQLQQLPLFALVSEPLQRALFAPA